MKTPYYKELFVSEWDKVKSRVGEAEMQDIYRELKTEGQEAMSRELIVQLISRCFGFWERVRFLACHRDLVIPFLFRIKQTATSRTN